MTQQSQPSEHGESAELREFRAEMRAFMREEAPKSLLGTSPCGPFDGYWGGKLHPEVPADVLRWRDVTLARGLTAPTWPKAYGGAGLTFAHAKVLYDEMRELGLPRPVVGFGFAMIGPTLLQFGNEEQKLQHLPAICAGEIRWCQGYSEPAAGSDLGNLGCRAVLEDRLATFADEDRERFAGYLERFVAGLADDPGERPPS